MLIKERIESFAELGRIMGESLLGNHPTISPEIDNLINGQQLKNPWFTPDNVRMAIKAIADELTYENLVEWTDMYPGLQNNSEGRNIGVVMAGNIPLAGFHDFISVLISGNNIVAKTSSRDQDLVSLVGRILTGINKGFEKRIIITEGFLKGFDAVIATGSDNTSRYFEYYFGRYPHIIRKNRNSVAIITGDEMDKELTDLGLDVFSYFGLGCRNVSKIFFPLGYNVQDIATHWAEYSSIVNHNKYANNYDYNKAIFMVNREPFTDTGFLLFKESGNISSPVAVVYHEFYKSADAVDSFLIREKEKIQCIVGSHHVPFGKAQFPRLWDYADGIDTLEFLLKKK